MNTTFPTRKQGRNWRHGLFFSHTFFFFLYRRNPEPLSNYQPFPALLHLAFSKSIIPFKCVAALWLQSQRRALFPSEWSRRQETWTQIGLRGILTLQQRAGGVCVRWGQCLGMFGERMFECHISWVSCSARGWVILLALLCTGAAQITAWITTQIALLWKSKGT